MQPNDNQPTSQMPDWFSEQISTADEQLKAPKKKRSKKLIISLIITTVVLLAGGVLLWIKPTEKEADQKIEALHSSYVDLASQFASFADASESDFFDPQLIEESWTVYSTQLNEAVQSPIYKKYQKNLDDIKTKSSKYDSYASIVMPALINFHINCTAEDGSVAYSQPCIDYIETADSPKDSFVKSQVSGMLEILSKAAVEGAISQEQITKFYELKQGAFSAGQSFSKELSKSMNQLAEKEGLITNP